LLGMNTPGKPGPATHALTEDQVKLIREKLKQSLEEGQTIKILPCVTNPQTGAKQIVAIPIQAASSSSSAPNLTLSPLKHRVVTVKSEASVSSVQMPQLGGVQVVSSNPQQIHTRTIKIGSPRPAGSSTGQVSLVRTSQSGQQVLTPLKSSNSLNSLRDVGAYQVAPSPNHTQQISHHQNQPEITGVKRADIELETFSESKRRKSEKGGKGLRHFSMKVCEKVKKKGLTSYNEVADELVNELTDPRCQSPSDQQYDQKNIRRRVYDALNVLMAMDIISKEKKEIRWLGLPSNAVQEAHSLEDEKSERIERIKKKNQQLQDLILQQIAFKNLVERNKETEKTQGPPVANSFIQLPFIILNTDKKTVIDCSISNDKTEYLFNFNDTFEIHDDMEVLKRMGMVMGFESGQVSDSDLAKAKNLVPSALQTYVHQLAKHGRGAYSMPKVSLPRLKDDPDSPETFLHQDSEIGDHSDDGE